MATRGRIPLSRVLEELDSSAGPVADGRVVMMTWEWTVTITIAQEKVYF